MNSEFVFSNVFLRITLSALVLFIIYLIKKAVVAHINKRIENINVRHNYRKVATYIAGTLGLILLALIWLKHMRFGLFFSVIGAGVVISLGDSILSFAGWLYIAIRKPFEVGDRVQIGEVKGDVVDIRGFYVTLLEIGGWVEEEQSTGRIVHIPNNFIFRNPVYNYTRGFDFIWNEIKFVVTFESDYKQAKQIALKHLEEYHNSWAKDLGKKIRQAQKEYAIYYKNLTPTVYTKVSGSGVHISLRYLVEPHSRRYSENFLCERVLDEFSKNENITFAYTTYRLVK